MLLALALCGPAAFTTYRVRRGDTLSVIAARNRTTVAALAAANGLRHPNKLLAGQALKVPTSAGSSLAMKTIVATAPVAAGGFYVVRPGDTLSGVAARFGVSPVALAAANGVLDEPLYVAARISVAVSPSGQPPSPKFPFVAQRTSVVGPGDTLKSVAKHLGVSTKALAEANGLSTSARPPQDSRLIAPGRWTCPVRGNVTFMNDWGFAREGGSRHEGIDLMAPRGRPVLAPVSGVVVRDPNHLGGNAFQLSGDDGVRYYGAHLDHYGASGRVKAGAVIGYVGNSGDADGGATHLHFEIHPDGGAAVPPYPTIAFACH